MQQTGFGDFLEASFEGIKEDIGYWSIWVAAVALIDVVNDLFLTANNGMTFGGAVASIIITLAGQSHLIRNYLERHYIISPDDARQPRIGAIFVISLLVGLASVVGLIFLIIPGLFLASRWFVSVPALFVQRSSATDAMRRSWAITEGHVFAIFGAMLVLMLPFVVGVATLSVSATDEAISLGQSLALNVPAAISTVSLWIGAAATFGRLDGGLQRRTDIFA